MCDEEQLRDVKTKSWAKKLRARQIQKLIRDIRLLERKRGTEKQLEKNKRRVERLHRKLEALRRLSLDHVCSLVTEEETTSPSATINAVEQALTQTVTPGTKCGSPVQRPEPVKTTDSAVLPLQDDFFVLDKTATDSPAARSNVNKSNERKADKPTSSHHSSMKVSLDSLFFHSLGDSTTRTKGKNRMGQRARQRKWEQEYGKNATHLKRTINTQRNPHRKNDRKMCSTRTSTNDHLHPSWAASKKRKQQANDIELFKGTHVVFTDDE